MFDGRVGLARGDGEVQIVEHRKQHCQKIELRLLAAVLEGFHQARAHLGGFFLEIRLCLLEFCLNADKFSLGRLAALGLGFERRLECDLGGRSGGFFRRFVFGNALALVVESPLVVNGDFSVNRSIKYVEIDIFMFRIHFCCRLSILSRNSL